MNREYQPTVRDLHQNINVTAVFTRRSSLQSIQEVSIDKLKLQQQKNDLKKCTS